MAAVGLQVAEQLVKRTKILKWMLNRLKPREFDPNKGSVGEVLAVLLQSSQENAQRLTDLNGIDALLQVPICHNSTYKIQQPCFGW